MPYNVSNRRIDVIKTRTELRQSRLEWWTPRGSMLDSHLALVCTHEEHVWA